ncbi:hypothetical protein PHAMO_300021 [Magnetospirillum molischianum DSM 120]|uniref:Uncharacterized protein n=1 Tax=Magnetospirillum molischianum DSM 120 TaxID=1150626 RepID=H8FUJ0_MAGML|nr:hypothetical protein PHAMO_300021 [Magnetospirillum molischianum DSM 120]
MFGLETVLRMKQTCGNPAIGWGSQGSGPVIIDPCPLHSILRTLLKRAIVQTAWFAPSEGAQPP